jgi:hypothetical protein
MSDTAQLSDTLRSQTLELIKQGQQATVQATEAWAEMVTQNLPQASDARAAVNRLPDAKQLTETAFDFAEQLLASHREFVTGLAGAIVPMTEAAQRRVSDAAAATAKASKTSKTSK